ncbi:RNA-splicing ligase RtcB, partial [Candidatus Woesearchaeota archaeon]
NVATLPGIQKFSFVMPDGHSGYGFPIGGVAAMDINEGVISPGGIGFDINCGVRSLSTNLTFKDIKSKLKELVDLLFKTVPTGVGCKGFIKPSRAEFQDVMQEGAKWAVENGFGWEKDLDFTEDKGRISGADPDKVSDKAIARGLSQLGTLGSGNHYLELQVVKPENIFHKEFAEAWNFSKEDQINVMIHCGSRGFGHQVASDYLKLFLDVMPKYGIKILDRELASAPFNSKEGQDYFSAMACAANMAFANRQVIMHRVRDAFEKVFKVSAEDLEMNLLYDVAHNIAKVEGHEVDGKLKKVIVHRKGATRAFGPSRMGDHPVFSKTGQPVLIGGSMETGSYLLAGRDSSVETFCSAAHGSGRVMSRAQAKRQVRGEDLQKSMLSKGIYVKAASFSGLAEEAGLAYKDVESVVDTLESAGITKKVVKLVPIGNIKG